MLTAFGHTVPREQRGKARSRAPRIPRGALLPVPLEARKRARATYEVQTDLLVAAVARIHRTVRLPSHAGPKGLSGVPHLQSRTGLNRLELPSDPSGPDIGPETLLLKRCRDWQARPLRRAP